MEASYGNGDYDEEMYSYSGGSDQSAGYPDDYSRRYDDDDDEGNSYVNCTHCGDQVLHRNYQRHLEAVHKCRYCDNYMPKKSIKEHIERKHMKKCSYCCEFVLETKMKNHCTENHPLQETIGMIQLNKISDERFNKLIRENRVYAKDGHLFIE